MQPNHYDLLGQVREPRAASQVMRDGQPRDQRGHPGQFRPSAANLIRSEDSWIELSSQPSSSSLSSAATNDDIITTGLQVEPRERGMYQHRSRRRRMQHLAAVATAQVGYSNQDASLASSSQEEYEESESESDPPMSSSNEDIITPSIQPNTVHLPPSRCSDETDSDDEDDTSTALGMNMSPSPFVPQPNVFSHPPPTSNPAYARATDSRRSQPPPTSSNPRRRPSIRRESYPVTQGSRRYQHQSHSPYNMISPSHHADHDAALRASLSTLLSCAAAARGIPKVDQPRSQASPPAAAQPSSFRLVGESVAMGDREDSEEESLRSQRQFKQSVSGEPSSRRPHAVSPPSPASKAKRRSASPKDRSVAKRSRRASMFDSTATVTPTVMTWVVSAGVVVLFSAISFSAGYMLGREVGRAEVGIMGDGSVAGARSSAACGQEAVRGGFKRFRWSTAAAAGSTSLV